MMTVEEFESRLDPYQRDYPEGIAHIEANADLIALLDFWHVNMRQANLFSQKSTDSKVDVARHTDLVHQPEHKATQTASSAAMSLMSSDWNLGEPVTDSEVLLMGLSMRSMMTDNIYTPREIAYAASRVRCEVMANITSVPPSAYSPVTRRFGRLVKIGSGISAFESRNKTEELVAMLRYSLTEEGVDADSTLFWMWMSSYLFESPLGTMFEVGNKYSNRKAGTAVITQMIVERVVAIKDIPHMDALDYLTQGVFDGNLIRIALTAGSDAVDGDLLRAVAEGGR